MYYARVVLAIVVGCVSLVPLVVGVSVFWLAARIFPSDAAHAHAERIGEALLGVTRRKPRASDEQLERIKALSRVPDDAFGPVHVTKHKPAAPALGDTALAAAAENAGRTVLRVDNSTAVLGPVTRPRVH